MSWRLVGRFEEAEAKYGHVVHIAIDPSLALGDVF
ncbi:hypothetical protein M7I_5026 [Glarea lozoyensis 74030]|uniref:Uncharacterized protein n=1 Tax=Glarea lozoyensis (strain ATCC 74030 / MF5533) TaxID=1104152 RepID=H0EQS1_GLAL7|nr:hypothetical protein M7I_5026 [Glarea lozoyensis 74030]